MSEELVIPLDDMALDALEHAINTGVGRNEDGEWVTEGGDFTLSQLLMFWSGYDRSKSILVSNEDDEMPDSYYPHPIIHEHDLIRALITEVRRLRGGC